MPSSDAEITAEAAAHHAAQASSNGTSRSGDFDGEAEAAGDDLDQLEPGEGVLAAEQSPDGDGDSDGEASVDFDPEIVEDPRTGVEVETRCRNMLPCSRQRNYLASSVPGDGS